jgi:hypothetical protein
VFFAVLVKKALLLNHDSNILESKTTNREIEMEFLGTVIETEADAQGFFFQLNQLGMLFHPEDNPADVINSATGQALFTPEQVELVRQRIDEVYAVMDDPCELILTMTGPTDDEQRAAGPY